MNSELTLLDVQDVLRTYRKIPKKKKDELLGRDWLPVVSNSKFSKQCAYMVAKVMGDGNLDCKYTTRITGQEEDLKELRKWIVERFRIPKCKIKLHPKTGYGIACTLQINDSIFGRFLFSLGAPLGNKTKQIFKVPKWIVLDRQASRSFLQGIFEDELQTMKVKRERYIQEAAFRMSKVEDLQQNLVDFLNQIREMTTSLNVECTEISRPYFETAQKDGERTYSRLFRVRGNRNNAESFARNIGFKFHRSKIKELDKVIKICRGRDLNSRRH